MINTDRSRSGKVIKLEGRVVESLAHKDLIGSKAYLLNEKGERVDSAVAGNRYSGGVKGIYEIALFSFKLPRVDSLYHLEILSKGYTPVFTDVRLDKIGGREESRTIKDIVLHKAPKVLDEVTVSVSKVKFFNRGDTVVFNADAFELAEGSMLDALIKQLPGVELKTGGQIYVNGEFVENLLLNGKDFFKGNNEVMLDNLAAYTVKQVEVYKKSSRYNEFAGIKGGERKLTMDVKLKKEYNQGYLVNAEAGGGTSDRYMGRLFVNRYTNHSRMTLVGNVNNLNDIRKPGESSTWTPESNQAGTKRTQMGGFDYFVENSPATVKLDGSVLFNREAGNNVRDISKINFLPGGNTYDYSFSRLKSKTVMLNTAHTLDIEKRGKFYTVNNLKGTYQNLDNDQSYLGALFNTERNDITKHDIETLYTGSLIDLETVVNRNKTATLSSGWMYNAGVNTEWGIKIPKTSDNLKFGVNFNTSGSKNESWRDYTINYGKNPTPQVSEKQYYDASPCRSWDLSGKVGYGINMGGFNVELTYLYTHYHMLDNSKKYALDRWGEEGVIGTLPQGWTDGFDAAGSYRSVTNTNTHEISLPLLFNSDKWNVYMTPTLRFVNRDFEYIRNGVTQNVNRHYTNVVFPAYRCNATYHGPRKKNQEGGQMYQTCRLELRFEMEPRLPDAVKMVDITDTNDPLNIYIGNPGLKSSVKYRFNPRLTCEFPVGRRIVNNIFAPEYRWMHNELVNGYVYETSTGVRKNKTYNVSNGNNLWTVYDFIRFQFGHSNQFAFNASAGVEHHNAADMIGRDIQEPVKSTVRTWLQNYQVGLNWQIKKQSLGLTGQINHRTSESNRVDFNTIRAYNSSVALTGNFRLPAGFGISTDFSVFMRRGYGSKELNTTDPVWNVRATYTIPKGHWTFMLDGFDMLHQLSNVQYALNAQGRTITYTNVLPRYFMLHVQYKINVMPKKKMINTLREWHEIP